MNKKTSALLRLIVSSLLAVILLAVLIIGIHCGTFTFSLNPFNFIGGYHYNNADRYQAGPASIPMDDTEGIVLKNLSIDWYDGEVNIRAYDGSTVEISEASSGTLDDKNKLHYYYTGDGALDIQYRASSSGFLFSFGKNTAKDKKLEVKIPAAQLRNLDTLTIDAASSTINLNGIKAKKCSIDTASGNVNSRGADFEQIDIDDASGEIYLQGKYHDINFDSASGSLTVAADTAPKSIDTDTASGNITLKLPEGVGFEADYDSLSGAFNCNGNFHKEDEKIICGVPDGRKYNFDSLSGDVTIHYYLL